MAIHTEQLVAEAKLKGKREFERDLSDIDSKSKSAFVGMGKAASGAKGPISGVASAIFGISTNLKASVIGNAAAVIAGLGTAAAGAIAPLAGLAAVLPAGIGAIGQAIASVGLATQGIGDALKAYVEQEKAAVVASVDGGQAARDAARVREQAARRVEQAERSLARAREAALEGAENAAEAVLRAEQNLARAQQRSKDAQEQLTQAREDAERQLRDLRMAAEGLALGEEQAKQAVIEASQELDRIRQDANASANEQRQAELRLKEAELRLKEVQSDRIDTQKELAEAEQKGIDGSDAMTDAAKDAKDAQQSLADAQKDVADAIKDQSRQQRDAAEAITAAEENLTDALNAQAEAATKAGTEGAKAAQKYQAALANLTPEARNFVQTVVGFNDAFKGLQRTVSANLFPGLTEAVVMLGNNLFPMFNRVLGETATVLGGIAQTAAAVIVSPKFMSQLDELGSTHNVVLGQMGTAAINLMQAFTNIAQAAQPLAVGFGELVVQGTQWLNTVTGTAEGMSRMESWFGRVLDVTKQWIGILTDLGGSIFGIFKAAQPAADAFLSMLADLAAQANAWVNSVTGQGALKAFFEGMQPVIQEFGGLIKDVVVGIGQIIGGADLQPLIAGLRELVPPLVQFIKYSMEAFGEEFIQLIKELLTLMVTLGEAGLLAGFIGALADIVHLVNIIVGGVPGMTTFAAVFSTIGTIGVGLKLHSLIGQFTGLNTVTRSLTKGFMGTAEGAKGLNSVFVTAGAKARVFVAFLKTNVLAFLKGPFLAGIRAFSTAFLTALPWVLAIAAAAAAIYLIIKHWDTIKEFFLGLWEKVKAIFKGALDAIVGFVKENWDLLLIIFTGPVGIIITVWRRFGDDIKNLLGAALSWIGDRFMDFIGLVTSIPGRIWNALNGMWNFFTDQAGRAASFIRDAFVGTLNWFAGLPGMFWNNAVAIGKNIANGVINGLNALIGGFEWLVNRAVDAINGIINAADVIAGPFINFGEVGYISLPRIPTLATGGNLISSGLTWLAEKGPELVNLPKGASVTPLRPTDMPPFLKPAASAPMGGGGNVIHIENHIAGSVVTEKQITENVRRNLTYDGKMNAGGILAGVG